MAMLTTFLEIFPGPMRTAEVSSTGCSLEKTDARSATLTASTLMENFSAMALNSLPRLVHEPGSAHAAVLVLGAGQQTTLSDSSVFAVGNFRGVTADGVAALVFLWGTRLAAANEFEKDERRPRLRRTG